MEGKNLKFTREKKNQKTCLGSKVLIGKSDQASKWILGVAEPLQFHSVGRQYHCRNMELDISKESENRHLLIDESEGLLIYVTELNTSLQTLKEKKDNQFTKTNCRS